MGELATLRRWGRQRVVWAVVVVGAAWVVAQVALTVSDSSVDEIETVIALAAAGWLATRRSIVSLSVIGVLAVFGWNPLLLQFGIIDVRVLDVPIVILIAQVMFDRSGPRGFKEGRKYVGALLALTGFATVYVGLTASENFNDAAASWVRLAVTVSLVWLTAAAVKTRRDFAFFLRILILAAMLAVAFGVYQVLTLGETSARAEAFGGPNALGLIAGMLVLAGLHASVLPNRETRVAAVATGLVGLFMAKSIASITGTVIAVIVGGVGTWSAHRSHQSRARSTDSGVRTWSRILAGAVVAFALISAVRPVDLPGSEGFGSSSTAIRLSVGYAGLEIWEAHPLVGVGWQQSSTDGVINAPSVVKAVEQRFGEDFRTYLELGGEGVTTVHNLYIQFLAETGIIGFGVLVWLVVGLVRLVRRWLRALEGDPWWEANARFLSLVLLLELVWWNDNPLFGGQPESLLAAMSLGLLAAAARIGGQEREEATRDGDEPANDGDEPAVANARDGAAKRARAWRGRVPLPPTSSG
jgi:O-antigen ligase